MSCITCRAVNRSRKDEGGKAFPPVRGPRNNLCITEKRCTMDKDYNKEVIYIKNLGYEVEIRRNNTTVAMGHGKTKVAALNDAIRNLEDK